MNYTTLFFISVYLLFNLVVTRGLLLDDGLTGKQKLIQALMSWLIPIIGGCVVIVMQGQNHTRSEMKALMPSPFYFVGHEQRPTNPFKSPGSSVASEDQDWSSGEGSCGGE